MFAFIRALFERFKARFVADAGLDFEAQLISRDAERKAVLLRKAARYDDEGLHAVAQELRHRAEAISWQRPLASLLPPAAKGHGESGNGKISKPQARPVTSKRNP